MKDKRLTPGQKNGEPLDFGATLTRALKYPWKSKALWFFGVLALLAGGGSGASYNSGTGGNSISQATLKNVTNLFSKPGFITVVAIVVVIIVVLVILAIIVGNWGLVAIIKGTLKLENGQTITRKEISKTGKKPVWGLIKINFLLPIGFAISVIIVFILGFLLFSNIPKPIGPAVGIVLAILFILALIVFVFYLSIIWPFAGRTVVVEDKKIFEAISSARKTVKGHFWLTFAYILVTYIINLAGSCLGSILFIISVVLTVGFVVSKIYVGAVIAGVFALFAFALLVLVAGYFKGFSESGLTIWWNSLKKLRGDQES